MKQQLELNKTPSFWYNKVPQSWVRTKNKFIFNENKEIVGDRWEEFTLLTMGKGGVRVRNIDDGGKFPESFTGYKKVKPDDLIFCLYDIDETPRTVGISKDYGMITSSYKILSTNEINNPGYWNYFYTSIDNVKGLKPFYTGLRNVVRTQNFYNLEVYSPPLDEQNKIVDYLDRKTNQINELIKKIGQKIQLLKEQRTSLINEVVTKGLNPDVEMKDSGIEWVGKIPTDWEVLKLKRVGEIYGGLTGKSGDDFGQEDSPLNKPYIPYTNIFRNTYISREHFDLVSIEPEETQNNVKRLDLFFLMSSENYDDLGKTSILVDDVGELYLNSFCKGFRINNSKINPLFLNYQLNGDVFKKLISINGFGFTRINLRQDKLLSISILLPPLIEQEQIILYLDKKTKVIDETISKEVRRIELLKEYKQSLISEVVTGKKRVV